PPVDLLDQSGLVDYTGNDAEVVDILHFYAWSLPRLVHGSTKYLSASRYLRNVGSKAYPENHLLVVLDGAPSHRSEKIVHPENVRLLELPAYSPELDPGERWFQEFRRELSNMTFESVALMQEALTRTLAPYWKDPALLKRLTGYPWWVEAVEAL